MRRAALKALAVASVAFAAIPAGSQPAPTPWTPTPERFAIQPKLAPGWAHPPERRARTPPPALKILPKGDGASASIACSPNNLAFQEHDPRFLGFAIAPRQRSTPRGRPASAASTSASRRATRRSTRTRRRRAPAGASGGGVQHWHLGTSRARSTSTPASTSQQNTSPDSVIQVYSLKAAKGASVRLRADG